MPDPVVMTANLAWMASCFPAYRAFRQALFAPQTTQENILKRIVAAHAATEFGRAHGFSSIGKVREYQERVPAQAYESFSPYIDRIRSGEDHVLTSEPVRLFEKTSGSSAAAKYIPYTDSLRREFQNAIRAWIFDLYRNDVRLLGGRSYWLITPLAQEREVTDGGIPVGFENDADYLGTLERRIAQALFAVPGDMAQVPDMESSLYLTLRFLIQADDLTLISVWNPSYPGILMKRLASWADRLLEDLRQGKATLPTGFTLPHALKKRLRADPPRARRLRAILRRNGSLRACDLWPRLRLISCWTSGAARQSLHEIGRLFPGVRIQGKGLLATEGIATLPWTKASGCLPALTSHFYEFLPVGGGEARLVHELEKGAEYSLLLTTGGGLYRYRLGDLIRVEDFYGSMPVLEFAGRHDGVSDLRGEKLSPAFVQTCLDEIFAKGARPRFAMLTPQNSAPPGYVLYLECSATPAAIGIELETRLRTNPHYDYCRRIGQLGPLKVYRITQKAQEVYLHRCEELGQRSGNVKPTSLHRSAGWEDFFAGAFVDQPQPELTPC